MTCINNLCYFGGFWNLDVEFNRFRSPTRGFRVDFQILYVRYRYGHEFHFTGFYEYIQRNTIYGNGSRMDVDLMDES